MLSFTTHKSSKTVKTDTETLRTVICGNISVILTRTTVNGNKKSPTLRCHIGDGKEITLRPVVLLNEWWTEFTKYGHAIIDAKSEIQRSFNRLYGRDSSFNEEVYTKLSAAADMMQTDPESLWEMIVSGHYECLVFLCHYNNSVFDPKDQKWYKSEHIDYIGTNLDESHYNLRGSLRFLKESQDPNISFVCEDIVNIPYYNEEPGRTQSLTFRLWREIPSPDKKEKDKYKVIAELLKDFKKETGDDY